MGSIVVRIDVDDKGNPAIAKLGEGARRAQKPVASLGDTMKKVFVAAGVLQGLRMLHREIRNSIVEANNFEQSLQRIAGVAQISGDALDQVRQAAKDISAQTEFSATEISDALLKIIKMGYDVEGAIAVLPNTVNLATASMEDLAEVSRGTINIMKAFGLESNESERVANVMATAFNATSLELQDYMDAMTYAAPIARSLNVSLEEASASIGLLTDMSIRGSHAGTTLKNTMLRLLRPTSRAGEILNSVSTETMGLADLLEVLVEGGMKTHELLDMFNLRAVAGALAIGTEADAVRELEERLKAQGVTAAQVADVMRQNYNTQLMIARQNLNLVVVELNELLMPAKIAAVQSLTEAFRSMQEWVRENQGPISSMVDRLMLFGGIAKDLARVTLPTLIRNLDFMIGALVISKVVNFTAAIKNMEKAMWATQKAAWALKLKLAAIAATVYIPYRVYQWLKETAVKEDAERLDLFGTKDHIELLGALTDSAKKFEQEFAEVPARLRSHFEAMLHGAHIPEWHISDVPKEARDAFNEHKQLLEDYADVYSDSSLAELFKTSSDTWRRMHLLRLQDLPLDIPDDILEQAREQGKKIGEEVNRGVGDGIGASVGDRTKAEFGPPPIEEWGVGQDAWNIKALEKSAKEYGALLDWRKEKEQEVLDWEEHIARIREERIQTTLAGMRSFFGESINLAIAASNQIAEWQNMKTQNYINNLNSEMRAMEMMYRREMEMASTSAFRREMLEQRVQMKKLENEEEIEKARQEQARREQRRQIFISGLNAAQAVLGVMADQPGGIWERLAAAATMAAATIPHVAAIAAANMRTGSGESIRGHGNSTSDSLLARVSKGERVLSQEELHRLGGNESVTQMIDRGSEYSSSSKTVYNIDTFVGDREWAEQFMDRMVEQLDR